MSAPRRRALVTGASSGIGAATARALAARGDRVALLARRGERLEEIVRGLPDRDAHLVLTCDATDGHALRASVARAAEAFGGLDLLVNNAGRSYRAPVEDLEEDSLADLFALNVSAALLACGAALPHLERGVRPVVVNVASVVGRRGFPTLAAYAASKAALVSVGESLRLEWRARGIAVCTLCPGRTHTEIHAAQENPRGLRGPVMTHAKSPEFVARAVLALDDHPRPELWLDFKWRWLGALTAVAPRLADWALWRRARGDVAAK